MELINISKTYKDTVFKNINYKFEKGIVYSIFGKNGIGKTTILNIISGFILSDTGEIKYNINEENIVFISENPIPFDLLTGKEFVIATMKFKGIKCCEKETDNLFKEFEIDSFKDNIISTYSKGMKYKLLIIIMTLMKPQVLILDEPFIDLDLITLEKVRTIFCKLKMDSIIIFSTHIPNIAFKLSDKILFLKNDKLIDQDNNFNNSGEIDSYVFNLMSK